MSLTRRNFLQAVAATTAGAVAFTGCVRPGSEREFQLQSPARLPEDLVSGLDNYYASVCQKCSAGCGVIVRIIQGRAQKLEGNPDYPVNTGKLSAQGQSGVQELYHPERLAGPLRRAGDRFTGPLQPIAWEDGLAELSRRLRELAGSNQASTVLLVSEPVRGHRALVFERFARGFGAQYATFDPLDRRGVVREAVRQALGFELLPEFDIANARYVLSFGADFLGTWLSPVHYGRAFGAFRQGRPGVRGHLVQVEPRMSATGAAADEWVPVRPGAEGLLALSIAQALATGGRADPQGLAALTGGAGVAALDAYRPERTAAATGVSPETVAAIARDFAEGRPALAIGGDAAGAHTNGLASLVAIYALNLLAGSVGQPGGLRPNPPSPLPDLPATARRSSFADWQRLAESMRAGGVNLLLLHGANPVHGLPAALRPREALTRVPYVVSFSSFLDETTALADLVLPDSHFLESWGDDVPEPGPGYQTVGFQQPVVTPLLGTLNTTDALLALAADLGGGVRQALPWGSTKELVQDAAAQLQKLGRGSVPAGPPEAYWVSLLQRGGWWDTGPAGAPSAPAAARPAAPLPAQLPPASFAGSAPEYPYHLHVYPSPALHEGQYAHLPWLQGLPDATTTAVWGTWLEVSHQTARELGVAEADLVVVESPVGSVEVPVYVYPAVRPDVVAMPLGQGHTAYTRYAERRGVNPLDLVEPRIDAASGALAWAATRVRVRKTGRRLPRLAKFEGNVEPFRPENIPMLLRPGDAGEKRG